LASEIIEASTHYQYWSPGQSLTRTEGDRWCEIDNPYQAETIVAALNEYYAKR